MDTIARALCLKGDGTALDALRGVCARVGAAAPHAVAIARGTAEAAALAAAAGPDAAAVTARCLRVVAACSPLVAAAWDLPGVAALLTAACGEPRTSGAFVAVLPLAAGLVRTGGGPVAQAALRAFCCHAVRQVLAAPWAPIGGDAESVSDLCSLLAVADGMAAFQAAPAGTQAAAVLRWLCWTAPGTGTHSQCMAVLHAMWCVR
jgi:hypothetical protein